MMEANNEIKILSDDKNQKRKPISNRIRFEVFKRDKFTCQYCGRMAPDVILEVDHINPVSNGGGNDILNLVTSCKECNSGKSKILLGDNSRAKLQQKQLNELAEKREQLEMFSAWREELEKLDELQVDIVQRIIDSNTAIIFSYKTRKDILKLIKKYGLNEVCSATEIFLENYFDEERSLFTRGISTLETICRNIKRNNPSVYWENKVAYAVNKKYPYVEKWKVRNIIKGSILSEEDCDFLMNLVMYSEKWSKLRKDLIDVRNGDYV